jgi:hypothetical protein
MSQFLGTTSGTAGVGIQCVADDNRLWPQWADNDENRHIPIDESFFYGGYTNGFWPRGGSLDASGDEMLESVWYDMPEVSNGQKIQYGISGVTRDVYGSPLGGVTVKLFRTIDDQKTDQQVSDANGNYVLSTPFFNDAHYIVEYKAGGGIIPDVFGSSVNTLIGG